MVLIVGYVTSIKIVAVANGILSSTVHFWALEAISELQKSTISFATYTIQLLLSLY